MSKKGHPLNVDPVFTTGGNWNTDRNQYLARFTVGIYVWEM
jgi:hypothetical protein